MQKHTIAGLVHGIFRTGQAKGVTHKNDSRIDQSARTIAINFLFNHLKWFKEEADEEEKKI